MSDRAPTSTYRLQLHAGFDFDAARTVVPYLARLGVSHLYLSPILQAAPGSMHGYDVVDHGRVSTQLGGAAGLERLAATAHEHGLGLVVDVVPNHMALPTPLHLNHALWETLRLGRGAPTAEWFDIDWELHSGRVGLPVLGKPLDAVLADGEVRVSGAGGRQVLAYHEQVFPLAPGTGDGDIAEVLAKQNYVLSYWRDKDRTLGYRRFFDVDTLIAVRVELPHVFEATHRVLLDLHGAGLVDGFRIDHPDGLADPQGYFEQLHKATSGAWVVAEKILEGDERLPESWPVAGTTGYDAARVVSQALAPPTVTALDEIWAATGGDPSLHAVELAAKRQVVDQLFQAELGRLTRLAVRAALDVGASARSSRIRDALAEILVQVEVYRSYLRPGVGAARSELVRLADQVDRTITLHPGLRETCELLYHLLTDVETESVAGRELIVRFQQVCGPVMAKGIEDTTFYRWHRLVALNEVGGDPAALAEPSTRPMDAWASYQQQHHPFGLTTLTTHDTKRSEDVRSRLLAVASDVETWTACWPPVTRLADELEVDRPTAYLVMQTLLGAWPISPRRLTAYVEKAVREAKQHTSWNDPDDDYEAGIRDLAQRCLANPAVTAAVESALAAAAAPVRTLTLAAKLLQLTLPGVPDLYQGCEIVNLSLVDPDNRRPVDFAGLADRLAAIDIDDVGPTRGLDDEKLLVTSRTLRLRRERPYLFGVAAGYAPLDALPTGMIGFARGEGLLTIVQGAAPLDPTATVPLPAGVWRDELSGLGLSGAPSTAELLARLPVSLLVREA